MNRLRGFLMNILNIFRTQSLKEVTGIKHCVSESMFERLRLWQDMAQGHAPWNDDKVVPCGILQQLAGRLHTLVSREISVDVQDDVLEKPIMNLNRCVEKIVDHITLFGGTLARPVFSEGRIQIEIIPLGSYIPIKYGFDGQLSSCVIMKSFTEKKHTFLLCEVHEWDGNSHKVSNTLYRSSGDSFRRVELTASETTEELTKSYVWENVPFPMVIEFRNTASNMIDGSAVPVALVSGAEDLIELADRQFERMNWEHIAGEKRIFADSDLFEKRILRNGKEVEVKLTGELNRLITKIDGDGSSDGKKINEWSPELRTTAMNEFLQQIFRRIELTLNVGKGTISDMESQVQTATQYSGGRQELYAIIDKIENEIERKFHECADVFSYMAQAYGLGKASGKIFIEWNDSQTRKDINMSKQQDLQEVQAGIMQKYEYRMKYYGEDEETAKANVVTETTQPFNPFME